MVMLASSVGPAEALLADLSKLVFLQEQQGWKIDRYEVDGMLSDALLSYCRVPPEQVKQSRWALDRRLKGAGGPLAQAYERSGRSLKGLDSLLHLHRVNLLFQSTQERAESDCPIYLEKDHGFMGEQTYPGRWSLGLEGGGRFGVALSEGNWSLGGGGGGRITINRVFKRRWTARLGLSSAGGAMLRPGAQSEALGLEMTIGLPMALRRQGAIWHHELELIPLMVGIPFATDLRPGIQIGATMGFSYLRVRQALPTMGFRLTLEALGGDDKQPAALAIRAGARMGFDWRLVP